MKKALRYGSLLLLLLLAALAATHLAQQAALSHPKVAAPPPRAVAADALLLPSRSQQLMPLADTLAASQRDTLFRQHSFVRLLRQATRQNGFWGPHPQRLEVVFTQVQPDARRPACYHVRGLARVRHRISALVGELDLQQVRHRVEAASNRTSQAKAGHTLVLSCEEDSGEGYITTGRFRFRQLSQCGALLANWQGTVAIDFVLPGKSAELLLLDSGDTQLMEQLISRGFAFEGTAVDARTHQTQRVLWAAEFIPLAHELLTDFGVGGRSAEINPQYARLGWNTYWQNDEWWVESGKAAASL